MAIKEDKNIAEISKTIKNYLDYMEVSFAKLLKDITKYTSSNKSKRNSDDLDIKRIKLIRLFNLILKKEVLSRDSYFLDVYKLTSNNEGINNNTYMCDTTHLTPKCLPILFKNYLYKI